jgi:hypothetical protein
MKLTNKVIVFIPLILISLLFVILRINPLNNLNVAYTYDQGRDFLKTAEIVLYKNPTFIGPTTGIMGIYHGAWWYYFLAIPFIIFKSLPIGFYYFNLFIHLILLAVVFVFAKKYLGLFTAIFSALFIAVSPYFVFVSGFVGNNIMVLPVILPFAVVNFLLIEDKVDKRVGLVLLVVGLMLGMIMEFEFAFGLFIIPAYLILVIAFKPLRKYFLNFTHSALFVIGLILSLSLRILFELKHGFIQSRTLLSFFFKPKLYNPKPYNDILKDRVNMFAGYYKSIFPNDNLAFWFTLALLAVLVLAFFSKGKLYKKSLVFFTLLNLLLFVFSTFYSDNFWSNYYEGIHYLMLFIILIIFSVQLKKPSLVISSIRLILLAALITVSLPLLLKEVKGHPKKLEGLAVQTAVVDYVYDKQVDKSRYCVMVYTPPVVPYTYDYLFVTGRVTRKINDPIREWVDNKCWFIIEEDDFKFRKEEWIRNNIPDKSTVLDEVVIKDVTVQLISKPL